MRLEEKIRKMAKRRYQIDDSGTSETATPDDFRLQHYLAYDYSSRYKLFRKQGEAETELADWSVRDEDFHSEKILKARITSACGAYLPAGLIADIVDLYVLKQKLEKRSR
jgi:hypothetical protein